LIHLGEGTDAIASGELSALEAAGCLTDRTVLIHAVALDAEATSTALQHGAAVVWCPSSNATVLGATLDPGPWLDAGRIALGTDSRASGDATMLDELRAARDASSLDPRSIVTIATQLASKVLRVTDAGALDVGHRADLLVFKDDGDDPYEQILRARRSDLQAVIVGGRLLVSSPTLETALDPGGPRCDVTVDGAPRRLATATLGAPQVLEQEPGLT
jgi:cytosine/adenosine deaminase-related metal-dependent hydrolase